MKLLYLLAFAPVAVALRWFDADPSLVFVAAALAVMPLADLMGDAIGVLARHLGPAAGGLLSASLNNAPEIIIALFALKNGLVDVVKGSITGSILGNLLFGTGLAMMAGGLKHGEQRFDGRVAGMHGNLLILAAFGLLIPGVFHFGTATAEREISREISVLLLIVYAGSLVYLLVARRPPRPSSLGEAKAEDRAGEPEGGASPGWKAALGLLVAVTLGLAAMSEIMTDALEPAARALGLTPLFAGVVLLAMVGNLPESYNAVVFARDDRMDLTTAITLGASTQVALLVAPLLVLCAPLLGQEMDLIFTQVEIVAIILAVLATRSITADGRSNWIEGLMLLAVYVMLAFGFFHLPASPPLPGAGP